MFLAYYLTPLLNVQESLHYFCDAEPRRLDTALTTGLNSREEEFRFVRMH